MLVVKDITIMLLTLIFFFSSCIENEKSRMARLVAEWQDKEIIYPPNMIFSVMGQDTVPFDFSNAAYQGIDICRFDRVCKL